MANDIPHTLPSENNYWALAHYFPAIGPANLYAWRAASGLEQEFEPQTSLIFGDYSET